MIRRYRDVAVVTDAGPSLHHQGWREYVRFVDRSALFGLSSGPLEASVCGSSGESKDGLLERVLRSPAEAEGQAILLAEIVIDLGVKRSAVFCEPGVLLIVVV